MNPGPIINDIELIYISSQFPLKLTRIIQLISLQTVLGLGSGVPSTNEILWAGMDIESRLVAQNDCLFE